jgi:hypothetical protein
MNIPVSEINLTKDDVQSEGILAVRTPPRCPSCLVDCHWVTLFVSCDSRQQTVGVLLLDKAADSYYAKVSPTWRASNAADQLWWDAFTDELRENCGKPGGTWFFQMLQECASNWLLVSDAKQVWCDNVFSSVDNLYSENVGA